MTEALFTVILSHVTKLSHLQINIRDLRIRPFKPYVLLINAPNNFFTHTYKQGIAFRESLIFSYCALIYHLYQCPSLFLNWYESPGIDARTNCNFTRTFTSNYTARGDPRVHLSSSHHFNGLRMSRSRFSREFR
jgi:hypothetical protein